MIERFDHIVLTVDDIPATIEFYQRVLGMTGRSFVSGDVERWALHFGEGKINLHQTGRDFEPRAQRATPGSADLCFTTAKPIDQIVSEMALQDVALVAGPSPRTGARGDLLSIYIRDPDGNLIEIANEL